MANPAANELSQLRDIVLPEPVGWWPLAPGWYLVLLIMTLSLIFTARYVIRYYKNSLSKRHALRLLKDYHAQYLHSHNDQLASARLSELLKRVALVYYPRTDVAGLKGDAWVDFLNKTGQDIDFTALRHELLALPYARFTAEKSNDEQMSLLFKAVEYWIKQRSKPCLN